MSDETIALDPAAPTPPPLRLLRRSSSDRIIGGVCGGLGRYWNVDPVILRVVFGVSLLMGGFGLFAYLALWLFVPVDTAAPDVRVNPSWPLRILGALAALVAMGIALALLSQPNPDGGIWFTIAVVAGVMVWIILAQRGRAAAPTVTQVGYAYGGTTEYQPTAVMQQPPAPARPRSYLGLIGLCASAVVTGAGILLGAKAVTILALALLALGLTMLVGGFRGRAKWLLWFAVPLLAVLTGVASAPFQDAVTTVQARGLDFSTETVVYSPTPADNVFAVEGGAVTVDFEQWGRAPKPGDVVSVDAGLGKVSVVVPGNWDLRLISDVGIGDVTVERDKGTAHYGQGTNRIRIPAVDGRSDGTLELRVNVRVGAVHVETGGPQVGAPKSSIANKEKAA